MHICFASLDYPDEKGGGGVGTYVQIIGRELVRQGHRVSVVALKRKDALSDVTDDKGVQVYRIQPGNIHWYVSKLPLIGNILALPVREMEYSNAVLKTVRKIDAKDPIDIVEGTETGAYWFRRLRPGIKTVIRLHGERYTFAKHACPERIPLDVRISRHFQRKAFSYADRLTAPSRAHADEIKSEMKGEISSIDVVPNPIKFSHGEEKVVPDPARPLFLYAGRLQASKGVLDLLTAIPLTKAKIPGARFVFAGSEHPSIPKQKIESLIDKLNIRETVELSGHVDKGELYSLHLKATAVVLPSYYETFGYVYLEALMHGLPVVAFDSGAARDLIVNGKNGFLVPVGDIDALADACVAAVHLKMPVPEKEDFAKYMPEQVCKEMLSLYEDLLRND